MTRRILVTIAVFVAASIVAPGIWPAWLVAGVLLGGLWTLGRDAV